MSVDDYMRRILAEQDAIRLAADPLGQHRNLLDTLSMQDRLTGIDRASGQITAWNAEQQKLRDAMGIHALDAARLAIHPDIAGMSALAAAAGGHLKLLSGPLDDLWRLTAAAEFASMRADILAMNGAYAGYSDRFRLPGLDEMSGLVSAALAAD